MGKPPPHRASVFRLRPRGHRQADLIEGTLPDTGDFWSFVMATAKAEAIGAILAAITEGPGVCRPV